MTTTDDRIDSLLDRLTLEDKVRLLTGRDFWTTWPIDSIGLRRILVSDGPSGVRGEVWDERSPSINLPSATALSSSWDTRIAARYGAVCAIEARRKGVDVVLGPTINLHRSPLGGRHFEAFSEDPVLTSELAAAYVTGVQRNGVGATPKHYVANDSETDRHSVDVRPDERALRELYLAAFEKSVTEAGAWLVMSAYNSVDGVTMTENPLLETPLNSEWGFDGVVVSDWTAVRSVEAANASQDLAMPGPRGAWGDALLAAVQDGRVTQAAIDRKVRRILLLAARVGALDGFDDLATAPIDDEDGVAFAREAAREGSVLVHNDGILPLDVSAVRTIAVIGHNAREARSQGGGSATVVPESVVSPLEGIRAAFPDARVEYERGAVVAQGVSELPLSVMVNPETGEPGAHVAFFDAEGVELYSEERRAAALVFIGGDAPIGSTDSIEFTTRFTPEATGTFLLGFAGLGAGTLSVDGREVASLQTDSTSNDVAAKLFSPPSASTPVELRQGEPVDLRVVFRPLRDEALTDALALTVGLEADASAPEASRARAVEAAARADVAVVVVGTNAQVESEGYDRADLDLPGEQDELVRAVAAANPRTVVIVNSGSPVLLPWRDDVGAILLTYFGGQEYGSAIGDMLAGHAEPGGRLPTTWPGAIDDVPVLDVTPQDGVLRYDEGIHIGYRAWLRAGRTPAYPFGHGLGFTEWAHEGVSVETSADGDGWIVSVHSSNRGDRAGKQVLQVYAEKADSRVERPARWLVGFESVRADAGRSAVARIRVPARTLAYWESGWQNEPGDYVLRVGVSSERLFGEVVVGFDHDGASRVGQAAEGRVGGVGD
ncbi:glycoside hydrolase family 3 C-terminal domain-containing protein [Herbiconiux sp. A18JL235]|uniref:Glycoside hydrolase family 3 C-terminal domain-containing protein n=1 Tax=Herbiconiux sp. A18JL235 TaxID=3152363 RepID=A0AB39BII0_9MICO